MLLRSLQGTLFASVVALTALVSASGPKSAINKGDGDVAVKGYDVVAYAVAGAPIKGTAQFSFRWNDATWLFSSAENRDRFAKDSVRYAPQFGGYCSWAVSRGYTADIDPEAWRIVDGRLYLNYSKSVQRRWEQDVPGNIAKGQANWPAVLNK
ncbi:MAG TPA: YHS domain-containing (seleno)protein [Vicinamibacterales bacterium]|nr:YHS domain-containing (seleno)protein [Vicinamibacterales bacterium]